MSIAVLDPQSASRARARAQAAAIADAPRVVPRFSTLAGASLRPSPRQRSHARRARPAVPQSGARAVHARRWLAAGVLLAEVAVLALALTLPAFRVRTVTMDGNHLLSTSMLLRTAGVPSTSIFTLDAGAVSSRLLALPWVATVTVSTDLPDTVRITVSERAPLLRLRRGDADTLLAANGAVLPTAAAQNARLLSIPVLVDDRIGSPAPIDPALMQTLSVSAQRFPAVIGCGVAAFQWGADGVFAIWTSCGWRAVLGHLDTDQAIAAVPTQLAVLAALKGQLDLAHPVFGYVDLDNLSAPAVGGSPGLPEEITAAATASDPATQFPPGAVAPPLRTPTPVPSATASPAPSPAATPTPVPA